MIALRFLPFLKTVVLKFAYYLLGICPILMIFWGADKPVYSFISAGFAFIAIHFLRRELKKFQPVHERNITEFVALGLFLALCLLLVLNRFGADWFAAL